MTAKIRSTRIEDWLDEDILETIEEVPDPNVDFNFYVRYMSQPAHVVHPHNEDKIVVNTNYDFSVEFLSNFIDRPDHEKDEFLARLQSILTNSAASYFFLTDDDEPCGYLGEWQKLRLREMIYPDGMNQDRLMNSIFDISETRIFVADQASIYLSQLDSIT